ncbi:hypothetical protein MNEG_4204 [Monoraphidium neglectum]|jgi:hypothetical protein|uniref:Uncharacterized protein n=1 Tax=Monoraphidium neglectum TaxID=145388 RepID=A0A0D2NF39_9CHLO|nr:hypothetical protein MNEG_4204 [Monoraphidium neglectum]KIZ03756.1 hypothetical protein MNEG_4204 [Monoraphidium neglectum]|eukprot:XP_013902775.1 hypothetical protein MNEG_4204 [Monoraphidium neglectum]
MRNELGSFKDEMWSFKDDMRSFKDDMRSFKDEMRSFKEELGSFKEEMRGELGSFKDDIRSILQAGLLSQRAYVRNLVACRFGDSTIFWPPHNGAPIDAALAGAPLPATPDNVRAAPVEAIDAVLRAYGLAAGPGAGDDDTRRRALLVHIGVEL